MHATYVRMKEVWRGLKIYREDRNQLIAWLESCGDLEGKTILLNGGTKGLGKACAGMLYGLGANLIITGRSADEASKNKIIAEAEKYRAKYKWGNIQLRSLRMLKMDLGDPNSVKDCAKTLQALGIQVQLLINNAGMQPVRVVKTVQGFGETLGVNYIGPFYFTQLLLKNGLFAEGARIVNVSSEDHRQGAPLNEGGHEFGQPWGKGVSDMAERYAESKLALTTFSLALAKEQKERHEVMDICPGPVASDIVRENKELPKAIICLADSFLKAVFPSSEEGARAVVKLALSDEFKDSTGVHFHMSRVRPARAEAISEEKQLWLLQKTDELISNAGMDYSL